MHTTTPPSTSGGVDPEQLERHIAEMYRDVANEAADDLHFPTGRPLAETLGYPADLLDRVPAEAVSSFAGVGYHLAGDRGQPLHERPGAANERQVRRLQRVAARGQAAGVVALRQ